MSNSICMSNVTSGFIDLATFDEIDKYLYGGNEASTYFVRETRKSTWFSQVPVALNKRTGSQGASFQNAGNAYFEINRHGDYFLNTWVEIELPAVIAKQESCSESVASVNLSDKYIMWTPNLGHNIIQCADLYFNDTALNPNGGITSSFLDFWAAFTVPSNKAAAYNTMIGNTSDLCTPHTVLPAKRLYVPLPFFYTLDSGVALPTAALPYSVIQIRLEYEQLSNLLLKVENLPNGEVWIQNANTNDYCYERAHAPMNVWGTYAVVSNDERQRMGCAPRDILIEQIQTSSSSASIGTDQTSSTTELNFSHPIKTLMFGGNKKHSSGIYTQSNLKSNYTTGYYYMGKNGGVYLANSPDPDASTLNGQHYGVGSPFESVSLLYENTCRLANMPADYYQLVNPYYTAPVAPGMVAPYTATPYYTTGNRNVADQTMDKCGVEKEGNIGLYLYSYSLDFISLDPMGSTNYGKLTHVTLQLKHSKSAREASQYSLNGDTKQSDDTYGLFVHVINNNILRVSGGQLGFPVL